MVGKASLAKGNVNVEDKVSVGIFNEKYTGSWRWL
jgi:hypothetical protein